MIQFLSPCVRIRLLSDVKGTLLLLLLLDKRLCDKIEAISYFEIIIPGSLCEHCSETCATSPVSNRSDEEIFQIVTDLER